MPSLYYLVQREASSNWKFLILVTKLGLPVLGLSSVDCNEVGEFLSFVFIHEVDCVEEEYPLGQSLSQDLAGQSWGSVLGLLLKLV